MYLITSSILVVLQLSVDRVVDCRLTSPALSATRRSPFRRYTRTQTHADTHTPRIISRGTFLPPVALAGSSCLAN